MSYLFVSDRGYITEHPGSYYLQATTQKDQDLDLLYTRIVHCALPTEDDHVATKSYTDTSIATAKRPDYPVALSAAGDDQATAAQVTTTHSGVLHGVGSHTAGQGVRLPTLPDVEVIGEVNPGHVVIIANDDETNALLVYPGSGTQINANALDAAITIPASSIATLTVGVGLKWSAFAATML
jgi:poly-gamma-glutamate capsule biosynthesis protein CapA/YwtB (metallophosphatase superfamily)